MSRKSNRKDKVGGDSTATVRTIFFAVAAVVALAGLADATYLTIAHLSGETAVCGDSAGCSTVLGSRYASVGGVPTAAFGAIAYFVAFSLAVLSAYGFARAPSLLAVVVACMFVGTLGFLYLQAFVLHAFCPFCLLSAAVTFVLAGLVLATPTAKTPS